MWIRNTAISCAFASCAMAVGPGVVGPAVANAGLFGIDWFGHDKKSEMHHPRPDAEVGAPSSRSTAQIAAVEAPTSKVGSLPENADAREFAAAESVGIPDNGGRGGGGGGLLPGNIAARAASLPRVSSAPVTRSVVIRSVPRSANRAESATDFGSPTLAQTPGIVALAAPPPVAPEPAGRPAPAAPPAPSQSAPQAKDPLAPSDSGAAQVPDSYRVGYAEYLRSATTSDLLATALPGVAGIAGFTLIGAYAGYRQARSLQKALLAPVPTSFLL